jgi:phosphoglycolate phosphatase
VEQKKQPRRLFGPEPGKRYLAAVFDMDGTILNTLGDLTESLNHVLAERGHRHDFTERDVAAFFGSGAAVAMQRALAAEKGSTAAELASIGTPHPSFTLTGPDLAEAEAVRQLYSPYYNAHCNSRTAPYEGIPELLQQLRAAGIRTAVVSNKGDAEVQKLVRSLFPDCFACSLGNRPDRRRKPAPDMVLHALEMLGVAAEDTVYIGDSEVDLQTAANSGLACISVDWGFRERAFLEGCHAPCTVSCPQEIGSLLLGNRKS